MIKTSNNYFFTTKSKNIEQMISSLSFGERAQRVYDINGSFFVKQSDIQQGVAAVASSRLYNAIGIKTPQVFILKDNRKPYTKTIQREVKSLNGLLKTLASSDVEFAKIETKAFGRYKWEIFYNPKLINTMLHFMTNDCLEALKDMFLADELRTDVDRRLDNYFFYKSADSDKYNGVIAIDLEQMIIYKYCGERREDFESFLYYPYQSATPQIVSDELSYLQRVRNIRELIYDGVLSIDNLETLKKAILYDFPKEIINITKASLVKGQEKRCLVSNVQRLWDYNQKTIGKDLGL